MRDCQEINHSLPILSDMNLTPFPSRKHKYPYKKARLIDYGGDMSRRWYIEFGIYDHEIGKVRRRRNSRYFKEAETKKERYEIAAEIIKKLNEGLPYVSLNNPNDPEVQEKKKQTDRSFYSLEEALEYIIKLKYQVKNARKTHHAFRSHAKALLDFAKDEGRLFLSVNTFKAMEAQAFADSLLFKGLQPQTVKNKITALRAIFGHMLDRGMVESNPFKDIKLPKVKQSQYHETYNDDEIKSIKEYCLENDEYLWVVIQLIYYCFLRPIEIGRLKVKHVLLSQKQIIVTSDISKNAKNQFVEIPDQLMSVFLDMNLHNFNRSDYLFTKLGHPGPKQLPYNHLGNRYRKVADHLEIPTTKTLYSWKHTGAVAAYNNGVDIKAIQIQCRHHSIEQTDTYLRSLGLKRNDAFRRGAKVI